ncbi:hypothetical protein PITC_023780 [Penicillium italicum]|uniref:Uncharacterized protein n=1 Tax=Penicillium italicum TaxID=40296 RepID=A0A0A2LD79_PENIT|nr:hypothetical protein PITC_023780 [Penicillium italicum]
MEVTLEMGLTGRGWAPGTLTLAAELSFARRQGGVTWNGRRQGGVMPEAGIDGGCWMSGVDEVEEIDMDKLEADIPDTVRSWLPGVPKAGIGRGCRMSRVDEVDEIDIDRLEAEPGLEDASMTGKPEVEIDRGCRMFGVDEVEEIDIDKLEAEPGVEYASIPGKVSLWLPGIVVQVGTQERRYSRTKNEERTKMVDALVEKRRVEDEAQECEKRGEGGDEDKKRERGGEGKKAKALYSR